jgi:hypothetical protein
MELGDMCNRMAVTIRYVPRCYDSKLPRFVGSSSRRKRVWPDQTDSMYGGHDLIDLTPRSVRQ